MRTLAVLILVGVFSGSAYAANSDRLYTGHDLSTSYYQDVAFGSVSDFVKDFSDQESPHKEVWLVFRKVVVGDGANSEASAQVDCQVPLSSVRLLAPYNTVSYTTLTLANLRYDYSLGSYVADSVSVRMNSKDYEAWKIYLEHKTAEQKKLDEEVARQLAPKRVLPPKDD